MQIEGCPSCLCCPCCSGSPICLGCPGCPCWPSCPGCPNCPGCPDFPSFRHIPGCPGLPSCPSCPMVLSFPGCPCCSCCPGCASCLSLQPGYPEQLGQPLQIAGCADCRLSQLFRLALLSWLSQLPGCHGHPCCLCLPICPVPS